MPSERLNKHQNQLLHAQMTIWKPFETWFGLFGEVEMICYDPAFSSKSN